MKSKQKEDFVSFVKRIFFAVILLVMGAPALAGDRTLQGTYLLSIFTAANEQAVAMLDLQENDGKLQGKVIASNPLFRVAGPVGITRTGQALHIGIRTTMQVDLNFDGVWSDGIIQGAFTARGLGRPFPAHLVKTEAKKLDPALYNKDLGIPELDALQSLSSRVAGLRLVAQREKDPEKKAQAQKELTQSIKDFQAAEPEAYRKVLRSHPDSPAVFAAAFYLLNDPKTQATLAEAHAWTATLEKAAPAYGPQMVSGTALALAEVLLKKEAFKELALAQARKAASFLADDVPAKNQVTILKVLSDALHANDKTPELEAVDGRLARLNAILDQEAIADARKVVARITDQTPLDQQEGALKGLRAALKKTQAAGAELAQLDARLAKLDRALDKEYLRKMPPFKSVKYAGRKSTSDRVVVLELFTGAYCGPCVAADLGFDGLLKSYQPTEVILLQYHLHVPLADPLANPDTLARADFYNVQATPWPLFNGERRVGGGGSVESAEKKHHEFRAIIDNLLEKDAEASIQLSAQRHGQQIDIQAQVNELKHPDATRLRFVLVEETVHYVGGNRLRFHHQVVRALPGGVQGLPLKEASTQHTATVNLDELRQTLGKYLHDYAAEHKAHFWNPSRPLELKDLRVVALVQDDKTKAILQAAQIEVGSDDGARPEPAK